jgi:hypothetical protein
MFSQRAPYRPAFVTRMAPTASTSWSTRPRVTVGYLSGLLTCPDEDSDCGKATDRPTGSITLRGYAVLAGAPALGALLGALLLLPYVGLVVGAIAGAVLVLPQSSDILGLRARVCCEKGTWKELPP